MSTTSPIQLGEYNLSYRQEWNRSERRVDNIPKSAKTYTPQTAYEGACLTEDGNYYRSDENRALGHLAALNYNNGIALKTQLDGIEQKLDKLG